MALKLSPVSLTTAYQTIYTAAAGIEASVHGLVFNNITATAATIDLRVTVNGSSYVIANDQAVPANKSFAWPKPINLPAGAYIEALASANSTITVVASVYEGSTVAIGFNLMGTWSSATTYAANDVVTLNGTSYAAIQASTNQNPATATAYWMVLASKGSDGSAGSSATVAVGATTTINPNVNPSVTNVGTASAADLRFSLPRAATVTVGTTTTVNPSVNPSVTPTTTNGDVSLAFSLPRAAAVTVGSTTTLAGGASATVTPTTTNGDVSLAFGVPQGIGYYGLTSATSNTIGTGSKTFTTNFTATATAFVVGERIRVINTATNWMEGTITAFTTTSLTVNVDVVGGSGTFTSWTFAAAGIQGATGSTGPTGPIGPKSITIAFPGASESVTMFYAPVAMTLTQARAVVTGTSPSVTYSVRTASDRSATGTLLVNGATITNATTGADATLASTSIAAGNWVWLTTSAASGTINNFHLTLVLA